MHIGWDCSRYLLHPSEVCMNVCARILQFTQVPTILGLALLLPSCSPIPREYIHQSERGVTLSALVSEPNRYQGKIVILGGVIVEEKEEGDQVFLRLKNRPLDKDYVPIVLPPLTVPKPAIIGSRFPGTIFRINTENGLVSPSWGG